MEVIHTSKKIPLSSALCNKYLCFFFLLKKWRSPVLYCLEKTIHNRVPNKNASYTIQHNTSVKIWLNILSTTILFHWHQCGIFRSYIQLKEKKGFRNAIASLVDLWVKTSGFLWYLFYSDQSGGRKKKRSVDVLFF